MASAVPQSECYAHDQLVGSDTLTGQGALARCQHSHYRSIRGCALTRPHTTNTKEEESQNDEWVKPPCSTTEGFWGDKRGGVHTVGNTPVHWMQPPPVPEEENPSGSPRS